MATARKKTKRKASAKRKSACKKTGRSKQKRSGFGTMGVTHRPPRKSSKKK